MSKINWGIIGCGDVTELKSGPAFNKVANSALVAPVKVGDRAYVGSGSVITREVPADALAIGRARQVIKEGWVTRLRGLTSAGTKKPK